MKKSDKKKSIIIDDFSSYLFWDVNGADLDMETHGAFIVKRVLEYGQIEDWYIIRDYYTISGISIIAQAFRELEPRALTFIAAISQTPKEKFR